MEYRRYLPHAAIAAVALIFWLGSCIHGAAIVHERAADSPVQDDGTQGCTAPGFCYYTEPVYDWMAGEGQSDIRFVTRHGYHHACPGRQAVTITKQRFAYERRNGKTGEHFKTLEVQPTEECQV